MISMNICIQLNSLMILEMMFVQVDGWLQGLDLPVVRAGWMGVPEQGSGAGFCRWQIWLFLFVF